MCLDLQLKYALHFYLLRAFLDRCSCCSAEIELQVKYASVVISGSISIEASEISFSQAQALNK